MKQENRLVKWSLISGIIASVAWIVGDFLLVGFEERPEKYLLFYSVYADKVDVGLATHMLSGSTERLFLGAFMPVFFVPFYFFSVYAIWKLFKPENKIWARIICGSLIATFAWSPLGHASFFFVGELYKSFFEVPKDAHAALLDVGNSFVKMLRINWVLPIYGSVLVWLVFLAVVLMKKTVLPQKYFWINPLIMMILVRIICIFVPQPFMSFLYAAFHNEGYFLFFLLLLILYLKKISPNY